MLTRLLQRHAERRMERLIARRTRIDRKLHRMGADPGWLTDETYHWSVEPDLSRWGGKVWSQTTRSPDDGVRPVGPPPPPVPGIERIARP